jgi:hypothetical protein
MRRAEEEDEYRETHAPLRMHQAIEVAEDFDETTCRIQ